MCQAAVAEILAKFTGNKTLKLGSVTTSEPGLYVESLGEPVTGEGYRCDFLIGVNKSAWVTGASRRRGGAVGG